MPVEIYSHNDAVATLLYHCGVSVNMNYSGSGSGAQSQDVETAMRSYFGYCGAKYRQKSGYQEEAWIAMLKAELDLSHPIYYSGANGDSGHAFVCDGYDENDFMHFNFGWSGSGDAFYSTYDVNGFNQGQAVVTNIFPVSIQADANGIIYVSEDGTGNGSSWANATDKLQFVRQAPTTATPLTPKALSISHPTTVCMADLKATKVLTTTSPCVTSAKTPPYSMAKVNDACCCSTSLSPQPRRPSGMASPYKTATPVAVQVYT